MDNLLRSSNSKPNAAKSKGQSSFLKRKDSGKVYDALVETSSIVTAFSETVLENDGAFEQSQPAKLTNHTKIQTEDASSNSAATHRSNLRNGETLEDPRTSSRARGKGSSEGVSSGRRGEGDGFSHKFVSECDVSEEYQTQQVSGWEGGSTVAAEIL